MKSRNSFVIEILPGTACLVYLVLIVFGSILIWSFNLDIEDGLTKYATLRTAIYSIPLLVLSVALFVLATKVALISPRLVVRAFALPRKSIAFKIYRLLAIICILMQIYMLPIIFNYIQEYGAGNIRTNFHLIGLSQYIVIVTIVQPGLLLFACQDFQVFPYSNKGIFRGLILLLIGIAPTVLLDMRGPLVSYVYAVISIYFGSKLSVGLSQKTLKGIMLLLIPVSVFFIIAINRATFEGSKNDSLVQQIFRRTVGRVDYLSTTSVILDNSRDWIFGKGLFLHNYLYEAISIVVPRGLWSDKPVPLSIEMAKDAFIDIWLSRGYGLDSAGGVSVTFIGEGLWSFGFIGVVLIALISGMIAKPFNDVYKSELNLKLVSPFLVMAASAVVLMAESFSIAVNSIVICCALHLIILLPSSLVSKALKHK